MNALLFERPVWFATGPSLVLEEAEEMDDASYHQPVLFEEAIEFLAPQPGALLLDGTCGGGGHTERMLEAGARVIALDQDPDAIAFARQRLAEFGDALLFRNINFRHAGAVLDELGAGPLDGALLDLGVSSRQLENGDRGFSFLRNGPLDMRMDPRRERTAADFVNGASAEELTQIFRDLGEEPAAWRIASNLVKLRKLQPFRETLMLARAVEKIVGRHGRRHPATQVFQALRMAVNEELPALEEGLREISARLAIGGRFVVLSFHSLEDRIVKNFFRDRSREWLDRPEWPEPRRNPDYAFRLLTGKPLEATEAEQRNNPRARSAKLRAVERIA